jgi:hypothetical protein
MLEFYDSICNFKLWTRDAIVKLQHDNNTNYKFKIIN